MSLSLLFLCPAPTTLTGNAVTTARLVSLLSPGGSAVVLDSDSTTAADVAAAVAAHSPRALIALHAVRSGRVLAGVPRVSLPPVILVLGGTDVLAAEDGACCGSALAHPEQSLPAASSLSAASAAAAVAVAFSEDLAGRFRAAVRAAGCATAAPPVTVIPQSVAPAAAPCTGPSGDVRAAVGLAADAVVVLWAGGLRGVKDPLYLLSEWAAWHARAAACGGAAAALVIVGPPLDAAVTAAVAAAAGVSATTPTGGAGGVFCLPAVPHDMLLAWLEGADVVVNSSVSEGQSNVLLEAATAGVPVVARRCSGNAAVVAHGVTGLLYDSPAAGVAAVAALCGLHVDGSVTAPPAAAAAGGPRAYGYRTVLAARLARAGAQAASVHHAPAVERAAWTALLERVMGGVGALAASVPSPAAVSAYVPRSLASLSRAQVDASELAVKALEWLGARAPFAAVVDPAAVLGEGGAGAPLVRAWGAAGDGDAQRWPRPPRVFDLSGAAEVSACGWGRYWEERGIYASSPHFAGAAMARTLHLGVDLGAQAGTRVCAPLAGRVHSVGIDASPLGYGPTVILQHDLRVHARGSITVVTFYTLYGHLGMASVFAAPGVPRAELAVGARVSAGAPIAVMGERTENGGWWPHVHFQLITELECGGWWGDFPGVARAGDAGAYRLLTPDANLLLRCPWVAAEGWEPVSTGSFVENVEVI